MFCPHCQHHLSESQATAAPPVQATQAQPGVFFELCSRCGIVLLDFGATRPKLHRAVEAQAVRWEQLAHLIPVPGKNQAG